MWNRIFKEISDRLTVPPIPTMNIDTSRNWQDTYRCFEDLRLGTENAKSPCPCVEPVTSKFVANVTRHEEFRFNSLLHRLSMSRQGAPLQEGASGDPIFVDFFRFSQFYPNSKDPDRKMARAPLHFFGTVACSCHLFLVTISCKQRPRHSPPTLRSLWLSRTVCMLFDAFLEDSQEDAFGGRN